MDERVWRSERRYKAIACFVILGPLIGALIAALLGSFRFGPIFIVYVLTFGLPFIYGYGTGPALLSGVCFSVLASHARKPFVVMACATVGGLSANLLFFPATTAIATLSGAITASICFWLISKKASRASLTGQAS